jgi:hypothetical protein
LTHGFFDLSAQRFALADRDQQNPAKPGSIVNIARAMNKMTNKSCMLHGLQGRRSRRA